MHDHGFGLSGPRQVHAVTLHTPGVHLCVTPRSVGRFWRPCGSLFCLLSLSLYWTRTLEFVVVVDTCPLLCLVIRLLQHRVYDKSKEKPEMRLALHTLSKIWAWIWVYNMVDMTCHTSMRCCKKLSWRISIAAGRLTGSLSSILGVTESTTQKSSIVFECTLQTLARDNQ